MILSFNLVATPPGFAEFPASRPHILSYATLNLARISLGVLRHFRRLETRIRAISNENSGANAATNCLILV